MTLKNLKESKLPVLAGSTIFILVFILTQYLSFQQYLISKKEEHELLLHELSNIKDKFRSILYNDITAGNTLVIMYKEYGGTPKNFDIIAQQIIENSKYVDALQLTKDGTITNVYPLKGYEKTIGINSLADTMRRKESRNAVAKKEIFFAGPRKLRQGGIGILGKIPIIIDDELKGFCVVLTKLPTLKKALGTKKDNHFSYILSKNYKRSDHTDTYLSATIPHSKSETVTVEIPEGDWQLGVAYSQNYSPVTFPYKLSIFGFLVSVLSGLLVYRKANERKRLRTMVDQKTHLVNERVKELSTIYKINNLLLDEKQSLDELFTKIVLLLPQAMQFPEFSGAKIIFKDKIYTTQGYKESNLAIKTEINVENTDKGLFEINYDEKKVPETTEVFLEEEVALLNSIARIVEIYLNKLNQKDALYDSETRFRTTFEKAAIGSAIVALDGTWLKVNNALCQMVGYSESELLKLRFQQLTFPQDLPKSMEALNNLISGKEDFYRIEKRYIHKNGSIVWINLNTVLIKDNNNKPLYFLSQIENITDKIESQTKFRDLVEKSLVGIYIIKDEKIVYANPQILEEYNYSENEINGMPIEDFIYEEDMAIARQKIHERILGINDRLRNEIRIKKKDGSLVWNEMYGVSTVFQGSPAIIGTLINISDKKTFYDELQKSEATMRSVFNSTEVSYLLVDTNFKIISFNKYFNKYQFEQTGENLETGMNFIDQIPEDYRKAFHRVLTRVLNSNTAVEFEKTVQPDSESLPKYYHFMVSPVTSNNGTLGICIANIEVTKQKNLEIERKHIINDLTQRNRDLEQFSYIVSHNMRMPISNLLGLINLLESDITSEDQIFINDSIKKSVVVLESVVTDVNEILSLRKNIMESKVSVDLNEIMRKIETELQNTIHKTRAKISFDFSEIATLYSISPFIHSIFLNLISNSLKYTNQGVVPKISIWTEKLDGSIRIYFKDNGSGIDLSRYGNKVFGLYKRFDLSKEGKGMGLFIVREQVNALNGKIEVESELGKGSTFIITLPNN